MTHELKCWPEVFCAIIDESKQFEYRKNDRGFSLGDSLLLREFDPKCNEFTGRKTRRVVTFVVHGGKFGVPDGFCVMSLKTPPDYTSIYTLSEPDTGEIRYVGISVKPETRLRNGHLKAGSRAVREWVQSLQARGLFPSLSIIERVDPEDGREREAYWIKFFSSRPLLNRVSPGESLKRKGGVPLRCRETGEIVYGYAAVGRKHACCQGTVAGRVKGGRPIAGFHYDKVTPEQIKTS